MKILFIHSLMFHQRTWRDAAERLSADGIELTFASQHDVEVLRQVLEENSVSMVILEPALGLPNTGKITAACGQVSHRVALGPEPPADFSTVDTAVAVSFKGYVEKVSADNYVNGIRYLAAQTGMAIAYAAPAPVRTTGIYHPEADTTFDTVVDYRTWMAPRLQQSDPAWVGLLFYYSQWAEKNTADVDAVIHALASHGLAPLCFFCDGVDSGQGVDRKAPPWLAHFRQPPGVEAVISFMAGRLLKHSDPLSLLQKLNVPIVQLLRSHNQSPDQWYADPVGLPPLTTVYSLSQPETAGIIAPTMVAGTAQPRNDGQGDGWRQFVPIEERIETLCRRTCRWVRLRQMANRNKRVTFVLHNNPCKGVEGTVGMAVGLDTFQSLAAVLQAMKAQGYDVGAAPADGGKILKEIMDRKAVSEFRWTTVDEIVTKGGALHLMDGDEYTPWFQQLPEPSRHKVLDDWEVFPGQGMATTRDGAHVLVITGLQYGNIRIMVQPKRGCYGPKCTGEVCRILHDPQLAPPHHWLATYKYIQDHSDLVIHFGTEGALEYLPGKQAGLSDACFPEISIGDLPHLYVYVMDVTGEGLTAKRRGQAVLVDHLTPVYRPAPLDDQTLRLEDLLDQYGKAEAMQESGRREILALEIAPLIVACGLAEAPPQGDALAALVSTARRHIVKLRRALMPEGLHVLSAPPPAAGVSRMLAMILQNPPPGLPDIETIAAWSTESDRPLYDRAVGVLHQLITGQTVDAPEVQFHPLSRFCMDVADRLSRCRREIDQLLRAMDGRYIEPGLSGSLSRGKIDALPTGRNFFACDVTALPTAAAWKIGQKMADKLLIKYLEEEDRFPESIGISIWSSDAFKSDGELLCQILYLMGVRPVWDNLGRVSKTEPIALEELTVPLSDGTQMPRPRVDITIQTSSIMRDMVPHFCDLMDRAVTMVSHLDEPEDKNFILKHTREQMARLRDQVDGDIDRSQVRRMATLRIFSSAPGTYGLGVGLALDASAWQTQEDLAEVYVNWGGHAYGADDYEAPATGGIQTQQLLADQLARLDVAYMKQSSAEYDVLDCGCYAVFQGGMATAAAAVGNRSPKLYWGESTHNHDVEVGELAEAVQCSARAKLLNPAWIEHMRRHGYQGAQNASSRVNNLFKWSATSGQVSKRLFDDVVRTYIQNEKNRDWLRQDNPYALEEITRRLLEAASRGLWVAEEEMLAQVRSAALEIEGDMEEIMGDVDGDFQGGKVEVLRRSDVDKWDLVWKAGT